MGRSTRKSASKAGAAPTKPSSKGKRGAEDIVRNDNRKKRKKTLVEENDDGAETRKTFIKEKDDEQELKEDSCVVNTVQVKVSADINPIYSHPRLRDENGVVKKDASTPEETPATDNIHIDGSENDHPKEEMDDREPKTEELKAAPSGTLIPVESNCKASKEDGVGKEESSEEEPSKMLELEESVIVPEENNSSEEISSEEDIAASSDEAETEVDFAPKEQPAGSKTLFVGNLSYSAELEQADLVDFFKAAGEIVGVRLAMGPDGSFRGFAHVDFTTAMGAVKALNELNGEVLAGHPVRLDLAKEKEVQSFQKGGGATRQTIFVCGFNKDDCEYQIRSALRDHFGSCGEITRVSIPRDKDGGVRGIAYIDFKNNDAYNQALKFNGSVFRKNTLTVEGANPRGGGWQSGRGSGGRFSGHRRGGRTRRGHFSGRGRSGSGRATPGRC